MLIFGNDKPIEKNHFFENNNLEKLKFNQRKENLTDISKENISFKNDDSIIFNGKEFKSFSRFNNYKTKDKSERIIYKCIYNRKNEKLRIETNQKSFCNATIECKINPLTQAKQYILLKDHSTECGNMNLIHSSKIEANKTNSKEEFIKECEKIMNSSNIYDRNMFKEEFKKLYNKIKHDFPLNNNFLSNIITNWKKNSIRFTKYSVLENKFDYNDRIIFREFRSILIENGKNNYKNLEYIIWANDENIQRIRKSNHLYIDGTFHHPKEFKQLLIIMYKDIITELKIPAFYILINGKLKSFYDTVFRSIINIVTDNGKINLNIKSIVTDSEKALMKTIEKTFPKAQRIACYFHYVQDIVRNLKSYGLFKNENSNFILKSLSNLPFLYNGNLNKISDELNNISKKYPLFENFINQYFITNKMEFFEDNSLNYNLIPSDCRTNNYLENYNGFIKSQLGKNRIINWVNFLHFIKSESGRSIEKLYSSNKKGINFQENKSFNQSIFQSIDIENNSFNKDMRGYLNISDNINKNNYTSKNPLEKK